MVTEELIKEDLYKEMLDEELVIIAQQGDMRAANYIINKYERMVQQKANRYFLLGSDRDDVIQEGFIGLFKAISDYDGSKKASFTSFAELCITRQIITSIKSATRLKHTPLNSYISFYKTVNENDTERLFIETIESDKAIDPLDYIVNQEEDKYFYNELMKALSSLEGDVFYYYLEGYSYSEIGGILSRSTKAIDNALQRIKRKVIQVYDVRPLIS